VFAEEEWQQLAVEDGGNRRWCSWRKNGSDWRGGGGQRKQTMVFVEEERHDGSVAVADACCLYFLGFQNECV